MKNFFKKIEFPNQEKQIIILLIISFFLHFFILNYPLETIFDEIYFSKFAGSYFTHQYYFDIHPPLGKLIIAGFLKVAGFNSELNFSEIGQPISSITAILLRFLPALFGTLFIILIYFLILKMGLSEKAAFLGSWLALFENAILTHSRLALIDIFLLFFGFLSLYFLISYFKDKQKRIIFLILAVVFSTFAFSIKWTGLTFFMIVLFGFVFNLCKRFSFKKLFVLFFTIIFSLLIYCLIFALHFSILNMPGPGNKFMSPDFNNGKLSTFQKVVELNKQMYISNASITAFHSYSSKWYEWVIGKKAIWYWSKSTDNSRGDVFLLPNPIIWFSALFCVFFSILILTIKRLRKKMPKIFYLLIFGFFANLLPFIFITRAAFLYHYFPSLIFGILIIAVLYDTFFKTKSDLGYFGYLALVLLVFILFSPLTYGVLLPIEINYFYRLLLRPF